MRKLYLLFVVAGMVSCSEQVKQWSDTDRSDFMDSCAEGRYQIQTEEGVAVIDSAAIRKECGCTLEVLEKRFDDYNAAFYNIRENDLIDIEEEAKLLCEKKAEKE